MYSDASVKIMTLLLTSKIDNLLISRHQQKIIALLYLFVSNIQSARNKTQVCNFLPPAGQFLIIRTYDNLNMGVRIIEI